MNSSSNVGSYVSTAISYLSSAVEDTETDHSNLTSETFNFDTLEKFSQCLDVGESGSIDASERKSTFKNNLKTFTISKWPAKPLELSPIICAVLGWRANAKNVLSCDFCKKIMAVSSMKFHSVKDIQEILGRFLESHNSLCVWRKYPFVEGGNIEILSTWKEQLDFLLISAKKLSKLPSLALDFGTSSDVIKEKCLPFVREISKDATIDSQSLILALFGWTYESGISGDTLRCVTCDRTVGLWNYVSTACENLHASGEPLSKKPKLLNSQRGLNPCSLHARWCPNVASVVSLSTNGLPFYYPKGKGVSSLPGYLRRCLFCFPDVERKKLQSILLLQVCEAPAAPFVTSPSSAIVRPNDLDDSSLKSTGLLAQNNRILSSLESRESDDVDITDALIIRKTDDNQICEDALSYATLNYSEGGNLSYVTTTNNVPKADKRHGDCPVLQESNHDNSLNLECSFQTPHATLTPCVSVSNTISISVPITENDIHVHDESVVSTSPQECEETTEIVASNINSCATPELNDVSSPKQAAFVSLENWKNLSGGKDFSDCAVLDLSYHGAQDDCNKVTHVINSKESGEVYMENSVTEKISDGQSCEFEVCDSINDNGDKKICKTSASIASSILCDASAISPSATVCVESVESSHTLKDARISGKENGNAFSNNFVTEISATGQSNALFLEESSSDTVVSGQLCGTYSDEQKDLSDEQSCLIPSEESNVAHSDIFTDQQAADVCSGEEKTSILLGDESNGVPCEEIFSVLSTGDTSSNLSQVFHSNQFSVEEHVEESIDECSVDDDSSGDDESSEESDMSSSNDVVDQSVTNVISEHYEQKDDESLSSSSDDEELSGTSDVVSSHDPSQDVDDSDSDVIVLD